MSTILERVIKVTADKLGKKEDIITSSSSFTDALGADSLDLVELIMGLEEEFSTGEKPIKIPDDDAAKIKTVQDAVDYLKEKGVTDNGGASAHSQTPVPASKTAVSTPKSKPADSSPTPKKASPVANNTASKTTKAK